MGDYPDPPASHESLGRSNVDDGTSQDPSGPCGVAEAQLMGRVTLYEEV